MIRPAAALILFLMCTQSPMIRASCLEDLSRVSIDGYVFPHNPQPIFRLNELTWERFQILLPDAKALGVAAHAHHGQLYDGLAYETHLQLVVEELELAGWNPVASPEARLLILAAWLHDTVEDTLLKRQTWVLDSLFGKPIRLLVESVTKLERSSGLSVDLQSLQNILKVRNHALGPALKAADRAANIAYGIKRNNLKAKYTDSYELFRQELGPGRPGWISGTPEEKQWERLDQLMDRSNQ